MSSLPVAGTLPAGVVLTPLRRIAHPLGDVVHGMKAGDDGFAGFGEAYFSHVLGGATKGWKRHRRMVLNLLVPAGTVDFHLHDEAGGHGATVRIDAQSPARLTVPPGLWMAFSAVGGAPALVLNLASLPHDPAEADTAPLERFARVPWEMP
ncbi:dTDP-4-dehydrorhamnose 3,5-epimerase [Ideonella sp. A 288]|uniref:dTDP-4-dehydrorhamnose 3,5-epimerase n=1 Tax=Ideonella sp. A 288 TaxID=1962181 RepID=UPI000B4A79E6|nr:dTDP-4-dehydrorhamnose 3,5-epimerase [Ideonella sp. A 288]